MKIYKLLLVLLTIVILTGCSTHKAGIAISNPGNYDYIKYDPKKIGGRLMRVTKVHDKIIYSYQRVYGPSIFTPYLLEHSKINEGESVLDIGTGTGVQAIFAASKASHVLATDIDKQALENTIYNARLYGVEGKISVLKSDLFNEIPFNKKFDVIIASLPYPWNKETQHYWELHERFFDDVSNYLNPKGRIYYITGLLNNITRIKKLIEKNNLKIMQLNMEYYAEDQLEPIVYFIQHAPISESTIDASSITK